MHEGVNLLKKVFNESCSVTSKTPYRIQSDFSYDLQVERYSMPPCPSHFRHAAASKVCMRLCSYTAAAAGSNILPIQSKGCYLSMYFINLLMIEGCSMVLQMIWPRNHTSHTKVYFYEFVANVLRDGIGIIICDLRGHGG